MSLRIVGCRIVMSRCHFALTQCQFALSDIVLVARHKTCEATLDNSKRHFLLLSPEILTRYRDIFVLKRLPSYRIVVCCVVVSCIASYFRNVISHCRVTLLVVCLIQHTTGDILYGTYMIPYFCFEITNVKITKLFILNIKLTLHSSP